MSYVNHISKNLLSFLIFSLTLVTSLPATAHSNNHKISYITGVVAGGHIGSRYRDQNYYRKRNHSRVSIGLNYGYPTRYRSTYLGLNYHYPLSYRRSYNDNYNSSDQLIVTTTGVFIGALIGSEISGYMNNVDRLRARDANLMAQTAPIGQRISWNNSRSNHYGNTIATRDGYSKSGKYCREFLQTINIGNRTEKGYGVACRRSDGTWKINSSSN